MNINIVILAAGKGTRMNSELPKVLHTIGGTTMIKHVLNTTQELKPKLTQIVVGHKAELIQQELKDNNVQFTMQTDQLGTGHAVLQTIPKLEDNSIVLILYGDVPLISTQPLQDLINLAQKNKFAILSAKLENPTNYGRIIRENGQVKKIVEQKDASPEELKVNEINTGIMAVDAIKLKQYLLQIDNNNSQNEYYLTDIVAMAVADNLLVETIIVENSQETEGVNNRLQQAQAERYYQQRTAEKLMLSGVTIIDPKRLDIRGNLTAGKDVVIDINTIFEGDVHLGDNVTIGANSIIKNSSIDDNTTILENCIIDSSKIGTSCKVGPFARIRPNTTLLGANNVGNFVEIKQSTIGKGSKINHLSYIGDTTMGELCNIGAGSITCNYDGAFKHKTIIGNNVFVGSDTQLIAPIKIDNNITIGAGSTLNKDVSLADKNELLILTRSKTRIINGWKRPKKDSPS